MDAYKIGVTIALANGVSGVLNTISRQMLGLNTTVGQVNRNFGRMATLIGGVAAVTGGVMIFSGLAKLAEHGSKVNHQLELMKIQGMDVREIQTAMSKSMEVTGQVMTTTLSENLKHARELRYAFGGTDDALKYLEVVSKANSVLNSVKGGGGDQVWELVKALEQKGLTANPDEFMSYVNTMTKAVVATGGKVTPAQFMGTFKYGRTAMLGWDENFVGNYLPRLIQSMTAGGGGGTGGPGNALMSAFAKVVQGQMPKTAAEEFNRLGLTEGGLKHIKGSSQTQIVGGIVGRDLFQANPYEWVQKVLMPSLAKHGITDQNKIIEEISKLFPVRTASQIIAEMGLQGRFREGDNSPFEKDAKLTKGASGVSSYDELIKKDYPTVMRAFHQQWKNLLETLGHPIVATATENLAKINSALNSMAQFAGKHPEGIKIALEALAALASSLIVAGLIALGVAIGGMIGVAGIIVAVAAGLAAFAALNWAFIKEAATKVGQIGSSIIDGLTSAVSTAVAAIPGILMGIGTAIINGVKNAIGSVFHGLGGATGGNGVPLLTPQNYKATPPAGGGASQRSAAVYLDGRKVGALITRQIADRATRPLEGSAYHDGTWHSSPSDTAFSMG